MCQVENRRKTEKAGVPTFFNVGTPASSATIKHNPKEVTMPRDEPAIVILLPALAVFQSIQLLPHSVVLVMGAAIQRDPLCAVLLLAGLELV